jgi:hypothetical protein
MKEAAMKIIVIAGGGRRVGKTTLAKKLVEILPNSDMVKLGTHAALDENPVLFFPRGTPLKAVLKKVGTSDFLVIESGAILDDPDLEASLVIFLPTADGRENKPGSERRRATADMIRGEPITKARAHELCLRLEIEPKIFERLSEAACVPVAE